MGVFSNGLGYTHTVISAPCAGAGCLVDAKRRRLFLPAPSLVSYERERIRPRIIRSRLLGCRSADRLDDEAGYGVRVTVCVRAAVFDVALAVLFDLPRDAN